MLFHTKYGIINDLHLLVNFFLYEEIEKFIKKLKPEIIKNNGTAISVIENFNAKYAFNKRSES